MAWASPRRPWSWEAAPRPLDPSNSEVLAAALQVGEAPWDGLSTTDGVAGLVGLGLGIGPLSESWLSRQRGKELHVYQVCLCINKIPDPMCFLPGSSRPWLGFDPEGLHMPVFTTLPPVTERATGMPGFLHGLYTYTCCRSSQLGHALQEEGEDGCRGTSGECHARGKR